MSLTLTKKPYGRCISANWQQGKTAGGWKDSILTHAKAVVVTVTIRQLFTGHAYNSPKPPWLSPLMIKISGRTHGGAEKGTNYEDQSTM